MNASVKRKPLRTTLDDNMKSFCSAGCQLKAYYERDALDVDKSQLLP